MSEPLTEYNDKGKFGDRIETYLIEATKSARRLPNLGLVGRRFGKACKTRFGVGIEDFLREEGRFKVVVGDNGTTYISSDKVEDAVFGG